MRFGIRIPVVAGLAFMTLGLILFARRRPTATSSSTSSRARSRSAWRRHRVQPAAARGDERGGSERVRLASGVVNTAFMMGGALGLAILASLAASRTDDLLGSGEGDLAALNGGYHLAFLVGAVFRAAAGVLAGLLFREAEVPAHEGAEPARDRLPPRPSRARRAPASADPVRNGDVVLR